MQPVASTDRLFSGNIADGRHLSDIRRKVHKMRVRSSSTGYSSRQPNTFQFLVTRLPADLPLAGSIGGAGTVFEAAALRFPLRLKDTGSSICWVRDKVLRSPLRATLECDRRIFILTCIAGFINLVILYQQF